MRELERALAIANRVLDEPYRDHDDDLSTVCRTLLRSVQLSTPGGNYPDSALYVVSRACYEAQWEDGWPREGTIDHALALQVGRAALDSMRALASFYVYARASDVE